MAGITPGATANTADSPVNFFVRCALEDDYTYLIEIGAFGGQRAARLATLFARHKLPIKVYALDIGPEYSQEREIGLVTAAPNNADMISAIARRHSGRGLLCSRGTLYLYNGDELAALIRLTFALGIDLAIAEPNASITERWATKPLKRGIEGWYHPYASVLRNAGYAIDDDGLQAPYSWNSYCEEVTFIRATTDLGRLRTPPLVPMEEYAREGERVLSKLVDLNG
jgi:hypothetical protein